MTHPAINARDCTFYLPFSDLCMLTLSTNFDRAEDSGDFESGFSLLKSDFNNCLPESSSQL